MTEVSNSIKPGSALHRYLLEEARQGTQILHENNLFDPATGGPQLAVIEAVTLPRMGQQELGLPAEINLVVFWGLRAGVAHEALGNLLAARAWYKAGQYIWRNEAHFNEWANTPAMEIPVEERDDPAIWQEMAALCAALLGDSDRATNLFTWSRQNYALSEPEMEWLEADRGYQTVWQNLGFQVFALAWLGSWDEIIPLVERGWRLIAKTRQAGHPREFREPQILIDVAAALAGYFRQQDEQTLIAARAALRVDMLPDKNPHTRANLLPFLWSLRRRYVNLAT